MDDYLNHLIYHGEWLNYYAITHQAKEFLLGLCDPDWSDFVVAATIVEHSVRIGRPLIGRAEAVARSSVGLLILHITPPERRGPKLRLVCARAGRRILVVGGGRRISKRHLKLAERQVKEFRRLARERRKEGEQP